MQDTIYQFEHADGVVGRINRKEGQGSKSEKLAAALQGSQPIVIVTIQTFPHVLKAIENSVSLKKRNYATYVLDFYNDPADVLEAFQEYYETAQLLDDSDPNLIWDLYDKLRATGIFLWTEVTQFSEFYFVKSKSNAAISNICRPAIERWNTRYGAAKADFEKHKKLFVHAKKLGDPTFVANAETEMKDAKKKLDELGMFKADLVSFTRYYEFMSQIVDYDSTDLEKLNLYARHLAPLLREEATEEDQIDLTSVGLTHYRLRDGTQGSVRGCRAQTVRCDARKRR